MIPQSPALAYAYFRLWELFFIFFFTNGNFPAILFKHHKDAPVVQLDRASDSGSECWGFESLRAYQARIDRKVYPSFFFFHLLRLSPIRLRPQDSPSWEGTRSGKTCHRHLFLASASGVPKIDKFRKELVDFYLFTILYSLFTKSDGSIFGSE